MALFKPYRVTSAQLNSLPIVEGQFIFVTDTKDLYFDVSTTDRLRLNADALTKLAGIENNANNYTLPVASTTLGGVKTTSTVTDLTDYEASPIVNGIVYSKNDPAITEFNDSSLVFKAGRANIPIVTGTKVIVSKTQPSNNDLTHEGDIWVVLE